MIVVVLDERLLELLLDCELEDELEVTSVAPPLVVRVVVVVVVVVGWAIAAPARPSTSAKLAVKMFNRGMFVPPCLAGEDCAENRRSQAAPSIAALHQRADTLKSGS